MDTKQPASPPGPTLPTNRAFVVQFRAPAADGSADQAGRVEHIVSGQAARFASAEELLAFITRVLSELSKQSVEEP